MSIYIYICRVSNRGCSGMGFPTQTEPSLSRIMDSIIYVYLFSISFPHPVPELETPMTKILHVTLWEMLTSEDNNLSFLSSHSQISQHTCTYKLLVKINLLYNCIIKEAIPTRGCKRVEQCTRITYMCTLYLSQVYM